MEYREAHVWYDGSKATIKILRDGKEASSFQWDAPDRNCLAGIVLYLTGKVDRVIPENFRFGIKVNGRPLEADQLENG